MSKRSRRKQPASCSSLCQLTRCPPACPRSAERRPPRRSLVDTPLSCARRVCVLRGQSRSWRTSSASRSRYLRPILVRTRRRRHHAGRPRPGGSSLSLVKLLGTSPSVTEIMMDDRLSMKTAWRWIARGSGGKCVASMVISEPATSAGSVTVTQCLRHRGLAHSAYCLEKICAAFALALCVARKPGHTHCARACLSHNQHWNGGREGRC